MAIPLVHLQAADPVWWRLDDQPAINPTANPEPKAAANIGQAKWMASRALAQIRAMIPPLADAIEADLVGTNKPIASWAAPVTDAEKDAQKAPLLIGQLKAISAPFYTHLNTDAASWLLSEMQFYNTRVSGTYVPWTSTVTDSNLAMASINQLKAVFSLRFNESQDGDETPDLFEVYYLGSTSYNLGGAVTLPLSIDSDHDGLPDAWEMQWFGNLSHDGSADSDGDGLSDLEEFKLGHNPLSAQMPGGPGVERFTYDDDGRLIQVTGPIPRTYKVDAAGNVQSQN